MPFSGSRYEVCLVFSIYSSLTLPLRLLTNRTTATSISLLYMGSITIRTSIFHMFVRDVIVWCRVEGFRHHLFAATAFQSFLLGAGYPTEVSHWTRSLPFPTRLTSTSVLNSASRKAWRDDGPTGGRDLWEMHGVWGYDVKKKAGVVLRENYFVKDPMTDKPVSYSLPEFYSVGAITSCRLIGIPTVISPSSTVGQTVLGARLTVISLFSLSLSLMRHDYLCRFEASQCF
jgi:hypothetical protein